MDFRLYQFYSPFPGRNHSRNLVKDHFRTDTMLHFFSSRVLNRWNSLSQDAVRHVSWCMFSECIQTAPGQDSSQQDEFLYGLVVHISLLAAAAAAQARVWQKQMFGISDCVRSSPTWWDYVWSSSPGGDTGSSLLSKGVFDL